MSDEEIKATIYISPKIRIEFDEPIPENLLGRIYSSENPMEEPEEEIIEIPEKTIDQTNDNPPILNDIEIIPEIEEEYTEEYEETDWGAEEENDWGDNESSEYSITKIEIIIASIILLLAGGLLVYVYFYLTG